MIGWFLALSGALAQPPTLDDVLQSVDAHFPLLVAAQAERDAAEGAWRQAQGGFDPTLDAHGWWKTGPYDQGYVSTRLSQATPLYGLELGAGWRYGNGDFATYDGWYDTKEGGEVFVDARLPLLKGGWTDERRTDILVAFAERDAASAKLLGKRIEVARKARASWYKWLGAGEILRVAETMRDVADRSLDATERRISEGDLAPISAIDARRVAIERQGAVLAAQQSLDAAAYMLSLYLRSAQGTPTSLIGQVPPALHTPVHADAPSIDDAAALASRQHPELVALRAKQRSAVAKQRLANISLLPKLDLKVELRQDLDADAAAAEAFDAKVGGVFEVSLLQRAALAKRTIAQANRTMVDASLQFAEERVLTEVRTAHNTLLALHQQATLADELATLASEVERATRTRYEAGDASLFDVYLREQYAMKAAQSRVYAWVAYHTAQADLLAATGAW